MYKLILVDKGQAPLQVIKCLMDHRKISLSIAMELVRQNEPVLYESENEQDILDLEEKLKKFGAVTKIINGQSVMLEEFEQRRRKALKSYERFKEVTLKQLDFIQSLEFEKLSADEKFFQQTKYEYMHGYLRCLRLEFDKILAEEKDL